jgi:beta-glucosidase
MCLAFKFSPFLKHLKQPETGNSGWLVEIFGEDPEANLHATPVYSTPTDKDLIDIPESLHHLFPTKYFVRARTIYTADRSTKFRFGFSVAGKGRVKIDNHDAIDLWTDQPPKTDDTPCFNRLSMERFYDLKVTAGQKLSITMILVNEDITGGVGTAFTLAGRLGGYEILDPEQSLRDAVRVARAVVVPIVMTGLTTDHESENSDRKHLRLPPGADALIEAVLEANPNAVHPLLRSIPLVTANINFVYRLLSPSPAAPSKCPGFQKLTRYCTPGTAARRLATASWMSYSERSTPPHACP